MYSSDDAGHEQDQSSESSVDRDKDKENSVNNVNQTAIHPDISVTAVKDTANNADDRETDSVKLSDRSQFLGPDGALLQYRKRLS